MGKKVVTFGELMLRLAPEGYSRFVQADTFGATYGGGEANVAVSLANYGFDAAFVTKLPEHEIGQAAVNALRKYGVNTDLYLANFTQYLKTSRTTTWYARGYVTYQDNSGEQHTVYSDMAQYTIR